MTSFEVVASYGVCVQDYVPSKPVCPACGLEVAYSHLAARDLSQDSSLWYHLSCFPAMPFLRADTEMVNRVFDRGNKEALAVWVRRHNAGLEYHRTARIESSFGQRLCAGEIAALSPVLVFLTSGEICSSAALVNRQWYGSAWNPRLWEQLWRYEGRSLPFAANAAQLHPKLRFALVALAACLWCNRSPRLSEVAIFCPVTLRPICRECRGAGDFLVTTNELHRRFGMTCDFVKVLKVPIFEYCGQTFTYFPMVIEAVIQHRGRRLEKVLSKVRNTLPAPALETYRTLKHALTCGFPLLVPGEPSKVLRYVLALRLEDSSSIRDVAAELRAQHLPNLNTDN